MKLVQLMQLIMQLNQNKLMQLIFNKLTWLSYLHIKILELKYLLLVSLFYSVYSWLLNILCISLFLNVKYPIFMTGFFQ